MVSRQYLGDSRFHIGFWRVARSVLIFLGAPLVAAILTRLIGVSKSSPCCECKLCPFARV